MQESNCWVLTYNKNYAIVLKVKIASSRGNAHNMQLFLEKFCFLQLLSASGKLNYEKPSSSEKRRSEYAILDVILMVSSYISCFNLVFL